MASFVTHESVTLLPGGIAAGVGVNVHVGAGGDAVNVAAMLQEISIASPADVPLRSTAK